MTGNASRPRHLWSAALAHVLARPVIAVVMGGSGSGKTTVSALLTAALGRPAEITAEIVHELEQAARQR